MSTTYYIRTYNCSFPTKAANCTSRNQILNFTTDTEGTLKFSSNFFNAVAGFYGFSLNYFQNTVLKPIKGENKNEIYSKIASDSFKTNIFSSTDLANLESSKWIASGWSSTLSTFKTELCSQIETNKINSGVGGGTNRFGSDAGEINMILFSCTFDDDPGKTYYTEIFYHGNDPQADETIVI